MKFLTLGIIFTVIAMYGYENGTWNNSILKNCNYLALEATNVTNLVNCSVVWAWVYNYVIFSFLAVVCFIKCRPRTYGKRKVMKFD